jgi:hypothetical protein
MARIITACPLRSRTETIDLSLAGLSFYLNTPIFIRTFLSLDIKSHSFLGFDKILALVVRIDTSCQGKQFVAAQFL